MSYSDPLPNVRGMTSLKVDNLANHTSSSTLKRLIEEYGPVGDVYIAPNHLTEERYNFAFIHFLNKHDAKDAMDALNGILLDGCKLRVQMMHNDVPRYTQSDCTQGGQHQYEEDNHESQSQSHIRSSPDNSQNGTQSPYVHRRLSSTKRSKSKSRPRSRNLPRAKGKKSKSRSPLKHPSKYPEGGGENMENKQMQKEDSDSDVIFVRSYMSKGRRPKKRTARHRTRKRDIPKTIPCVESKEDPLHDMLPCDIDSNQPTTFEQHEVIADEEQKECQSWEETSLNKSQGYNSMEGESVNDNCEKPGLTHDHLYFARLLGEQNMNKQREVENAGSNSMFKRPHISEGNATDTLMEGTSVRSQTRKRHRNPDNRRERPWMENDSELEVQQSWTATLHRELMEYNLRQREYPQSESILTQQGESKEDETEMMTGYNRRNKKTRRNPRLPKSNWNRCGAKPSDVVPNGESERGQHTSFQQSEERTEMDIAESGAWKTKHQRNTNNAISGGMRSTFKNENLNPQNEHGLLSGLRSHESNGNSQKQIDHHQPKSTFTTEGELMEYNQRQSEYPQSESILTQQGESKEDETEILTGYNRLQKKTRRNPRLPKSKDWNRCGAKPSDVVPNGESERGQHTSFQQSEERTEMDIAESGSWETKHQSNTNNAISGGMRSTFSNENFNPQNEHALLSGIRSHECNRNSQKQIDHHQPKSTFTTEGINEISTSDTLNRARECTINEHPEVSIVREVTESRLPQPTQHVALSEAHYSESDESSSDLEFDEPCLLCRLQSRFPLSGEFNISRMPRSSSSTSPRREHTENTDHRGLSTSVTPTDKEHTNVSSDSGETDTQNSKIVSAPQASNTCLDFTIATAPCGTSGQTITEDVEGERDNCTDNDLEVCDSVSRENIRVNHGDTSVPTSTSISISHTARHTGIIYSLVSMPRPGPTYLPTFVVQESRMVDVLPTNVPRFQPLPSSISLFGTMPDTQFTNGEDSDDSDSWPTLPDFANFNDIHNNHPKGLTKKQIESLPVRAFTENDQLIACSICLTEYTENSKIRVLTCCHEYHDECIDPWLSENSTCPVCRRQIINPPDTEILF